MRKASTCWKTCGKDVVRRRCRGKGSLQRRGVSSCVQWKVNGTLPPALFSISMHSSHWLADKVQRSTDCFFFPEPPGGVVPRGEGGALSAYRPGLPALGPQGPGPSGPVLPTVPTPPGSQAWHTNLSLPALASCGASEIAPLVTTGPQPGGLGGVVYHY